MDKVNVPLICKHNKLLMESALCSSEIKKENMRIVRDTFGTMDGEFYYCKHCGEVIDYQKYSEFEGFGRGDKVINVREAVVEDDEDEDEDIINIATIQVNSIRRIVNLILRKTNMDLRVNDYKTVLEVVTNRIDKMGYLLTDLKAFYYDHVKGRSSGSKSAVWYFGCCARSRAPTGFLLIVASQAGLNRRRGWVTVFAEFGGFRPNAPRNLAQYSRACTVSFSC